MHIIKFSILLGSIIYAITLQKALFNIFLTLVILYTIIEYLIRLKSENTLKTKMTFCNFNDTGNPSVFLNDEIDVDIALNFIKKYNNKENSKKEENFNKLSLEIITLKALGNAFNNDITYGKICLGNFIMTKSVDICVLEKIEKKLFSTIMRNCNNRKIEDINAEFKNREKKNFYDDHFFFEKIKNFPNFVFDLIFKILTILSYDLNLSIPFFNYKKDNFGQILFFPAGKNCMSFLNLPLFSNFKSFATIVMNNVKQVPIIKENGELGVKNVLGLCLTFDHRFGDGSSIIEVLPKFKEVFDNPEKFI